MRIQKKVLIWAFIGIFLFCSAGLSWAKEPIKIGIPLALTGDFAPIGVDSRAGVQFAVDKINGDGGLLGRPVEIVLFDIKDLAPERLMAAADKLIGQDKVDTVHAGWAGWGQDIKALVVATFHILYTMNPFHVEKYSGRIQRNIIMFGSLATLRGIMLPIHLMRWMHFHTNIQIRILQ
jgi:hypothetical protein